MRPSSRCVEAVKRFEGCRLTAYPDPGSGGEPYTIGYGHTGPEVTPGLQITQEQADRWLAEDLDDAAEAVNRLVAVPITQGQFDALCSFVFNCGAGAFEKSTLRRLLNAGDRSGAADELLRWNHAGGKVLPGLTTRREAERAMFLGVDTSAPAAAPSSPVPVPSEAGVDLSPRKPMIPILGAVLPSLVSAIPELIKVLGDKNANVSERNVAAATKVMDVIVQATGATNEQDAAQRILADPAIAAAARQAVQSAYYDLVEVGGGIQSSRAFVQQLVTTGPDWQRIASASFVGALSLTIVVGGGAMMWSLLHDPTVSGEQRAMLIGAAIALINAPVAWWFGSSASSRRKDDALASK